MPEPNMPLIAVADIHAGCRLALCRPSGANLDDGGRYQPSKFQRKLWRWWREFWDDWVPKVTEGEPFCVVTNGDSVDGRHHNAVSQWSQNLADQEREAYEILAPVVAQCDGRYYHLRGTEAHGGVSGENEERLADRLGAIPNKEGQYARHELWKWVGGPGKFLTHFTHHIGTTGSSAYESTAVYKELVEAFVESARWGHRPPDAVVRAHRHRFFRTEIATGHDRAMGLVLPGWQGKTPFVYKINARQSMPQFGGIMIRVSSEREPYVRHFVKSIRPPKPE